MGIAAQVFVALVAAAHIVFMALEVGFWTRPLGRKVFRLSRDEAAATAALAKNQGVYNLFLAAGLIWSLVAKDPPTATALATFFLVCVVVAALVGALTAAWQILIVQGLPAAIGLALIWF